jgi:hypothetical protein
MATSKKHPDGSPNWGGARPRKKTAADAPAEPTAATATPSGATNGHAPAIPAEAKKPKSMLLGADAAMAMLEAMGDYAKRKGGRVPQNNPFQLPEFPPGAVPKDKKMRMAMDQSFSWASDQWLGGGWGGWAQGVFSSIGAEGLLFLGYPYLSELAQRPEYRVISETIADDATRKWIDFEVTGAENEESGAREERQRDAERSRAIAQGQPTFQDIDPDERKAKLKAAGKTDKVKALKDEIDRLELRDRFYAVIRDDGFFGRSHMYLNFGEDSEAPKGRDELKSPIGDGRDKLSRGKVSKDHPLRKVKIIEPVWVYPIVYNAVNPLADDWYNPQTWYVMGREIHVSRMLPFVTRPVPDLLKPAYSFGGLALSQMAKPYVDIWLTTRQSIADLIHAFSIMCLGTDMMANNAPGGTAGAGNTTTRAALFNAFRDNMGLFLYNLETEDFKNVSAPLGGLHELQSQAQEHMSLPEGTTIHTARGQIAIEDVNTDDRVLTRAGFAPIKWAGITGTSDALIEIEAAGSVLQCTGNHPVWSESTSEFVNAEIVSLSHRLLVVDPLSQENTESRLLGAASGGGARNAGITAMRKAAACFIGSCGRLTEGSFQKATNFITRTRTAPTIVGTILSFSLVQSMRSDMVAISAKIGLFTRACVQSVGDHSKRSPNIEEYAVRVKAALVERVTAINVPRQSVYDIVVEDGWPPEFFANGILVHNSSVSRIPLVKLTGISPAGLNASSEGEIRVYYDTISAYQNRAMRPHLTRIINFVQLSLWNEIDPEIKFEFEPLWDLSAKELAELQKAEVERDEKLVDLGAFAPAEIRKIKINDPKLPYTGLDPDELPDLRAEETQGLIPEGAGRGIESIIEEGGGEGGGGAQSGSGGGGAAAPQSEAQTPEQALADLRKFAGSGGAKDGERGDDDANTIPFQHGHGIDVRFNADGSLTLKPSDAAAAAVAGDALWNEGAHKRGQPDNAGQFGSGGGGGQHRQQAQHHQAPAASKGNALNKFQQAAQRFLNEGSGLSTILTAASSYGLSGAGKEGLANALKSVINHAAHFDPASAAATAALVDHMVNDFGVIAGLSEAAARDMMSKTMDSLITARKKLMGKDAAMDEDGDTDGVLMLLEGAKALLDVGKSKRQPDKDGGKSDKQNDRSDKQAADADKTSKDLVAYVDHWADTNTQCRACSMFVRTNDSLDGNACELVAGEISALGHCRQFTQKRPSTQGGEKGGAEDADLQDWTQALEQARKLDRRHYLDGLKEIVLLPDTDHWNAHYDADKDEIGVQQKLREKPIDEQVHVLLHEAGHRGHYKVDPEVYARFKKAGLVDLDAFLDMANQAHLDDYAQTGKVDGLGFEIFAESYARAMLGLEMPEPLGAFWAAEGLAADEYRFMESLQAALTASDRALSDAEWNRALEMWADEGLTDPGAVLERLGEKERSENH